MFLSLLHCLLLSITRINASFVSDCYVPYTIQYAISRINTLGEFKAPDQVAMFERLKSEWLFRQNDTFKSDFEVLFGGVLKVCAANATQGFAKYLEVALRSSVKVDKILSSFSIHLTEATELDFAVVDENLGQLISFANVLNNNNMQLEKGTCLEYIRTVIALLKTCETDQERLLTLEKHLESTQTIVSKVSAIEPEPSETISYGVFRGFQYYTCIDAPVNPLPRPFESDTFYPLLEVALLSAKSLVPEEIIEKWLFLMKQSRFSIYKVYKTTIQSGFSVRKLYKLGLSNTHLFVSVSSMLQRYFKEVLPLLLLLLMNCCDRFLEVIRLLLYLGFKTIEELIEHPFESLMRVKALGFESNILGQVVECQLDFLANLSQFWHTQVSHHSNCPSPVDSNMLAGQWRELVMVKQIFDTFPNPTLLPTIDPQSVPVPMVFVAESWMPRAFMLIAKRTITDNWDSFEAKLSSLLQNVLNGIKSKHRASVQVGPELVQKITLLCRKFGFTPKSSELQLLNLHFKEALMLVECNLTKFIPMSTIESFSDLVMAKLEYIGVLYLENVGLETINEMASSFNVFVKVYSESVQLTSDERFIVHFAIFTIQKWIEYEEWRLKRVSLRSKSSKTAICQLVPPLTTSQNSSNSSNSNSSRNRRPNNRGNRGNKTKRYHKRSDNN